MKDFIFIKTKFSYKWNLKGEGEVSPTGSLPKPTKYSVERKSLSDSKVIFH
jgi:hypothetical protein